VEARKARSEARTANEIAREANSISHDSNTIAERAIHIAERDLQLVETQVSHLELDRREQEEARQNAAPAEISISVGQRDSNGRVKFKIINQGPHVSRDLAATLSMSGHLVDLGSASLIFPMQTYPTHVDLGHIAGTYDTGPDNTEVIHPAISGDLTLTDTDGNGPQTIRKQLHIGAGSRFDRRQFTLTDLEPET